MGNYGIVMNSALGQMWEMTNFTGGIDSANRDSNPGPHEYDMGKLPLLISARRLPFRDNVFFCRSVLL